MFELWVLDESGWRVAFRADQLWKVQHEASRWPKGSWDIVEPVKA